MRSVLALRLFAIASIVVVAAGISCATPSSGVGSGNAGEGAGAGDAADAAAEDASASPSDAAAGGDGAAVQNAQLPLVVFQQDGVVLTSMRIVTITFQNELAPVRARVESFDDFVGSSQWWHTVTDGYCVEPAGTPCIGPAIAGEHVILPVDASPSYSIATIGTVVGDGIADGTLPAPTSQTVYTIYVPSGVTVSDLSGGISCSAFEGIHFVQSVTPPGGASVDVPIVLIPHCTQDLTFTASHELIETATDPFPSGPAGFIMEDLGMQFAGDEVADLCLGPITTGLSATFTMESGFSMQRSWSNESARAGHDPCVPAPQGIAFFVAGPTVHDLALAEGESTTFDIEAYTDGPVDPWSVTLSGGSFDFSWQTKTMGNGDRAPLTITLTSAPSSGRALFSVVSTAGEASRSWTVAVSVK